MNSSLSPFRTVFVLPEVKLLSQSPPSPRPEMDLSFAETSSAAREGEPLAAFPCVRRVSELRSNQVERQRRGSYQPGPTAQENPARSSTGLKARFKPDRNGTGFQPLTRGWTATWAVGPGWYEDGPLALRKTQPQFVGNAKLEECGEGGPFANTPLAVSIEVWNLGFPRTLGPEPWAL
jgi:hypothetical protein